MLNDGRTVQLQVNFVLDRLDLPRKSAAEAL